MKKVLLILLALFLLLVGITVVNLKSKTLYWFSEVDGQVLQGDVPLEGVKVIRSYRSDLYGNHEESTETDTEGRFHFDLLTGHNGWWFLAPLMHGGLYQTIEIKHQDSTYTAWWYWHSEVTENNQELKGKPIQMICDLEKEEREIRVDATRSIRGISNLGLAYDQGIQKAEGRLTESIPTLQKAAEKILTSEKFKNRLAKGINEEGVIHVDDIHIDSLKELSYREISLTEDEDIISLSGGISLKGNVHLQTRNNGLLHHLDTYITGYYLKYNLKDHTLSLWNEESTHSMPFDIDFHDVYQRVLERKISIDRIGEGLNEMVNHQSEYAHYIGMEAVRGADKLLKLDIDSIHVSGSVDIRETATFVRVTVYGQAEVLHKNERKKVAYDFPLSIEFGSIDESPYVYRSEDYIHLWKKTNGQYKKISMNQR